MHAIQLLACSSPPVLVGLVWYISASGGDFAVILMEAPSEDGSVLTKESMDTVWEIDALVMGIQVCATYV